MGKDVVHIYNGILLSHKKNGIIPFAASGMDLEVIILSDDLPLFIPHSNEQTFTYSVLCVLRCSVASHSLRPHGL